MAVEANLNTISTGYNRSTINENFELIATALEDALSRSGTSPNEMVTDLDLNSNDLLNVGVTNTDRLIVGGTEFVTDEVLAIGPAGAAATIEVGTVTTGAAGTDVVVTNVGDEVNAVFDITIPRGDTGASGAGTGDMVAAQNLNDVVSKPTAFANIKQAATESDTGVVELATVAEANTGTDTTRAVTPAGTLSSIKANSPEVFIVSISDETTSITTGTAKVTFRIPFDMTLTAVRASLSTVSSSGTPTFDINKNGTTMLSTKLTIDANEKTSTTATTAAVISVSSITNDDEITIDIDTAGTGAKGAKITLIGTRT